MSWLLGSYFNWFLLVCKKTIAFYILYAATLFFLMAFRLNLLEFPRPTIRLSENNYVLSFSFPISYIHTYVCVCMCVCVCVCVISFSCLTWLARIFRALLYNSNGIHHSHPIPDFIKKILMFSSWCNFF